MYLVAFFFAHMCFRISIRKYRPEISAESADDFSFVLILGLLLGARLGSVFLYSDAVYYATHPWMIFWPFEDGKFVGLPGMSYHGGLIGAIAATYIYCKRKKLDFAVMGDMMVPGIPLGYTFGRLGNFINGELYGRVTTFPLGMVFPAARRFNSDYEWVRDIAEKVGMEWGSGTLVNLPRHPSQLYEAFFEGIFLFLVLWFIVRPLFFKKGFRSGSLLPAYLIGYGAVRFALEYFRQPDAHIGYVLELGGKSGNIYVFESLLNISKGQVFCFLMVLIGAIWLIAINVGRGRKR